MPVDLTGAPTVRGPAPPPLATPARRPGSVRRTATIDMTWPEGRTEPMLMLGRARDLHTRADGTAVVLAEDVLHARTAPDRTVTEISTEPHREVGALVGVRGGGRLRAALAETVPAELAAGTPLYLLLDDVAGASLVGGFAWSQWTPDWMAPAEDAPRRRGRRMEGICTGFQPGSRALDEEGYSVLDHRVRDVEPLTAGPDPLAWHALPEVTGVSMRRSRRIDIHLHGATTVVDSFFQDSATTPAGGRIAVHEYRLLARVEAGVLAAVEADPRVLPYLECPLATRMVDRMVGTPVGELRAAVLERLKGVAGCTHLNDALRALAEVDVLTTPLTEEARCT